jgi:hypothetical protein
MDAANIQATGEGVAAGGLEPSRPLFRPPVSASVAPPTSSTTAAPELDSGTTSSAIVC